MRFDTSFPKNIEKHLFQALDWSGPTCGWRSQASLELSSLCPWDTTCEVVQPMAAGVFGVEPRELKAEKLGGRFRVFSDLRKRFTIVWPSRLL